MPKVRLFLLCAWRFGRRRRGRVFYARGVVVIDALGVDMCNAMTKDMQQKSPVLNFAQRMNIVLATRVGSKARETVSISMGTYAPLLYVCQSRSRFANLPAARAFFVDW